MLSFTEENYLKAIYRLSEGGTKSVLTSEIAEMMSTKAASVTDMIKKLSLKNLIGYEKYYGVKITKQGKSEALMVIRKHRLWETFLVEKLQFTWDEVHDVAEQLEHIQSNLLIEKLDEFLGFPTADPHGHPIPDKNGKIQTVRQIPLADLVTSKKCVIRSVKDGSPSFLQYLSKIGVYIGAPVVILEKIEFDGSLEILIDGNKKVFISRDAAQNLLVTE
ncbi:metal-dependent transcriptional regulator [Fulvivirgaceae bacterium PWU4]|uniref:Transcriptional regulator MntR n=1 Tax=Chryseosolibacter histidini TaxID=2782349 RepID=A0AAP2DID2_9BACT|nr:metal-dependent transcriptional regulator [Chryseosolibacter histidini]MBT1696933.1 metal-dependent transcriptional regulator [Chryseosolibacter histidini]